MRSLRGRLGPEPSLQGHLAWDGLFGVRAACRRFPPWPGVRGAFRPGAAAWSVCRPSERKREQAPRTPNGPSSKTKQPWPSPTGRRTPVSELPTGTITFLYTDIRGSTKLWEEHPTAMKAALARHDACLRAAIETHRGHIFKPMGAGFCAAFAQASDALLAALAAQQSLHAFQTSAAPAAA